MELISFNNMTDTTDTTDTTPLVSYLVIKFLSLRTPPYTTWYAPGFKG